MRRVVIVVRIWQVEIWGVGIVRNGLSDLRIDEGRWGERKEKRDTEVWECRRPASRKEM